MDIEAELRALRDAIVEMARRYGRTFLIWGVILALGIGLGQVLTLRGHEQLRKSIAGDSRGLVDHLDSVLAHQEAEIRTNTAKLDEIKTNSTMIQHTVDTATAQFQVLQAKVDAESRALGIRVPRPVQPPARIPVVVPTPVEVQLPAIPPITPVPKAPCSGPLFGLLPCGIGLHF